MRMLSLRAQELEQVSTDTCQRREDCQCSLCRESLSALGGAHSAPPKRLVESANRGGARTAPADVAPHGGPSPHPLPLPPPGGGGASAEVQAFAARRRVQMEHAAALRAARQPQTVCVGVLIHGKGGRGGSRKPRAVGRLLCQIMDMDD